MNFVSSITLMFKDSFSAGFTSAKNSLAGMRTAMGAINKNNAMNRLAADISMMSAMTEPLRQKLSAAMNEPSEFAKTFESTLKNIQSVSGATSQQMRTLRGELLLVGGRAVAGPQAVAAAYYDIASGVTNAQARMGTLAAAVAMSEAGQANLGAATNGLIKVVNAYGLTAEQTGYAADVFTQTVGMGVGSMDEFVAAISPIAGLTASVGLGFDEVGNAMAYMTAKGQTASLASTQLRAAVISLLNPNRIMRQTLAQMGVVSGSAMLRQYGLAESLQKVSAALGGSKDAMARALGSTEALQAATAITQADFAAFTQQFSAGLDGITESARAVQIQSYEAKLARMEAASASFKIRVGQDINTVKGFFVDLHAGFLSHVINPILSSPAGPAFTKITAVIGLGAKSLLDIGSGSLAAAAQLSTLTANIQNAGGITALFKNSIGLLGAPFASVGHLARAFALKVVGIGASSAAAAGGTSLLGVAGAGASGGIGAAAGVTGLFGTTLWATLAPLLAVVAGIAVIAGGGYLIVRHWGAISGFFGRLWMGVKRVFGTGVAFVTGLISRMPNWLVGLFAVLFPFVSLPLIVVKNWGAISGFFGRLWTGVKEVFIQGFSAIKTLIYGSSDWVLGAVAVFMPIVGIPALVIKHWDAVKAFFPQLWDGIKTGFSAFVAWIAGAAELFVAPFRTALTFLEGIFSKFGAAFKVLLGISGESGSATMTTFSGGITAHNTAPTKALAVSLGGVDAQLPHSDARTGPLSRLTASGRALMRTFSQGIDIDSSLPSVAVSGAVDAISGATVAPAGLRTKPLPLPFTAITDNQGISHNSTVSVPQHSTQDQRPYGALTVSINNLYVEADDCQSVFDFVRVLQAAIDGPKGSVA